MDNADVGHELPGENTFETLQDADGTIDKIINVVEELRSAKRTLISKEDKTPDDEAELERITTTLDRELKTMNELFIASNELLMKIQTQTYRQIVRDNDQSVSTTVFQESINNIANPYRDSSEFHQVLVVNRNTKNGLPPTIMVLESMTDFGEVHDCRSCSTITECELNEDSICCNTQVENSDKNDTVSVNEGASKELYYARLNGEVCKLKENTQDIIKQNEKLRFELESTIERNNLLAIILQCPTPFKTLASGEITFPGKKEMEEKILLLKEQIVELNGAIKKIHINQLRLKTAKEIMIANQNNSSSVNCQCKCPKENYDRNNVKVKNQQIKHIKSQIIEKNDELNQIIISYNSTVRANSKIIAKNKQLNDNLIDLKNEIKIYDCAEMEDIKGELNKKNEEIETIELIIKENKKEIDHYDEKLKDVLCDIKEKTNELKKIEVSLAALKTKYEVACAKLKSTYQEQLEEMIALPKLLKASLVKLQEEIDKKTLAKETRDKLEREISEEQNKKKPFRIVDDDYDEKEKKLKSENQMIKSRLKFLEENIKSETENLNKQVKELDDIREQVAKAASENTKHINAFKKFSTIQMEKICNEIQELQELLTKLQTEECAKSVVQKSARKYLTSKLESIQRNLEKCRLDAITFLNRPNERMN